MSLLELIQADLCEVKEQLVTLEKSLGGKKQEFTTLEKQLKVCMGGREGRLIGEGVG